MNRHKNDHSHWYNRFNILTVAVFLVIASFPLLASAQAAVLGYKINAQNQVGDSGFTPTLEGPGGTISLTGNPYNSGFITNGTYTSRANATTGWNTSYWLCYDQQTSCTTPTFVSGNNVSVNLTGTGQSGDHVTLWWKYAQVQNLGAVLGYKLDGTGAQTSMGAPTLVGPAGTITLTGNPYNSNFIAGGTYTAYANAPAGYTASYWLCYDKAACTTPSFVLGNSVSITVSGTGSDGDYVTLWWRYAPQVTGAAVIGLRVGADNQTASAPAATPTLVGPGGTVSLTGNPFNSGFVINGTYTSYANAPAGYTASYWLCYGTGSTCTTPNFVTGDSVSISVSGTQQPNDVVTLWWKYSSVATNAPCTFNGATIPHGTAVTAYQTSSVPAGQSCMSQQRTCNNGTLSGTYTYASCSVAGASPIPTVVPGTVANISNQWNRGTILLRNFVNMYNGHVHVETGTTYPYKMWFFGWAATTCNSPTVVVGAPCDAIFYARSADGISWQVYSGDAQGNPQFDSTQTPSLWKPIISARNTFYDHVHNGDPSVVKVGNTYYMVYSATGNDVDGIASGQPGDTDQDFQGIMGAVSTDGIHWTRAERPYFAAPGEAGGRDTAPGNMYHRPSLMYENGKFKMWFDYWVSDEKGLSMGYAELPMSNPTGDAFLNATFNPLRVGNNPLIINWPNPNVVKVGTRYYSYADPVVTTLPGWQARAITEAVSDDGLNWQITGYVEPESGCAATHVPEAYIEGSTMYVTYGCQKGGNPYDFQYTQIRRMQKSLSGVASPITPTAPPPSPPSTPPTPPIPPSTPVSPSPLNLPSTSHVGTYCPNISQNLKYRDRDARTTPPGQVTELQKFLADYYDLNPNDTVTGYFGPLTLANVKKFQIEHNIDPPAGFVGSITRAKIAEVCRLASASRDTQVANALSALESALKVIQGLLR